MSILKLNGVTFKGIDQKETDKKQLETAELPIDEDKSKAAKYMIGAAALAGVIAAGIIAHKQGWLGKAAKKGEDIVDSASRKNQEPAQETTKVPEINKKEPECNKLPDNETPPEQINQPDVKKQPEVKKSPEPEKSVKPPKLEGKALIENNLQSLNSGMDRNKIVEILSGTVSEIRNLPQEERMSYIDKYLESIKKVSAKFPENISVNEDFNMNGLFDFYYLAPGDNKIAAEKLINFVKENPKWKNLVTDNIFNRTRDMFYSSGEKLKQEAVDIRKMLLNSNIKPEGVYDIDLYNLSDFDKYNQVSRDYFRTTLKLSLKTGMDEFNSKCMLDALWESPEKYQKLLGVNPLKIDSAVKKSYKKLTGKTLDYHYVDDAHTKWAQNDVKSKLSKKTYIDSDIVDYFLEPAAKEGSWSSADMHKYYTEDLNIEKHFSGLSKKEKNAFRKCRYAIEHLPKDMQAEYYAKYFEGLKKYTPEELRKIDPWGTAFDFSDINMAGKIIEFGKTNPQYSQMIAGKIIQNIRNGVLDVDDSIKLMKLLEKEEFDLTECKGTISTLTGLNNLELRKNPAVICLGQNNKLVSVDKANEFRSAAFELYLQNGVTQKAVKHYTESKYSDDFAKLFGMTKNEFISKINEAVNKNA